VCEQVLNALASNFLSNICNGTGTVIGPMFWDGQDKCETIYEWPKTEIPTPSEWQAWQQTLTIALSLGRQG